jgi:hypothetical protein
MNKDFLDFLVVGAYALAAQGLVRATVDFDILVRPTPENAQRVFLALMEFGAPVVAHHIQPDDFAQEGNI